MSHTTPATYLVWAIMSCLLGCFLVYHLWKYDKFRCMRWNNGPYSGAFKRLMTYTYLFSVPCIMAYALGFAVISIRRASLTFLSTAVFVPKPWQMWSPLHKSAILPLYLLFTIGWSFELVTHLEELCFWLFLINSGSDLDCGSVIALTYMPLVTIFTREDPTKCEAFTFLAGSLGSLSLTLWFMPILWAFPSFCEKLKRHGVDKQTLTRLATFHELNCLRVVFRFLFVVPLLILAVDGVRPHQHVNESPFWTEMLTSLAAIGCVVSSAITLVVFFPRSNEASAESRHATFEKSAQQGYSRPRGDSHYSDHSHSRGGASPLPPKYRYSTGTDEERESAFPVSPALDYPLYPPAAPSTEDHHDGRRLVKVDPGLRGMRSAVESPSPTFSPNRRGASGVILEGRVCAPQLTESALAAHNGTQAGVKDVHPFLHNFTSPIDIMHSQPKRWYVKKQDHPNGYII
ncbi:uncharacterized protein BXZ73DRAFT_89533 [Epithele typhae]|uniref:uncharacterized protein n=1 Tax=Epithele typhae TaxID=378194 RepID=UPI00200758AC|nr:uncharacterized protein BXZ73DRAFT_89533 [Epithele typhae]KAH9935184.1 hypothetical protein BXZ73DRAFT_89533 [Epithele typhae]